MLSLAPGDVVFAPFPFEEDATIFKNRPCLVLAVRGDTNTFLAAKLTTTRLECYWAVPLKAGTSEVSSGSILKDSWINLNRREWLDLNSCIYKLATLKEEIFEHIVLKVSGLE